jgi:hypothetical protein
MRIGTYLRQEVFNYQREHSYSHTLREFFHGCFYLRMYFTLKKHHEVETFNGNKNLSLW